MAATLAQLLAPITIEQAFQIFLGVLQSEGFPVQSWQEGGTELTRELAFATGLVDISSNFIPPIAGGVFLDYADSNWLSLTAHELYEIDQNPATFTVGNITLTSASGVALQVIPAGQLIAVFAASGNRYRNQSAVTIPVGPGTVSAVFVAENAGAKYNDPPNSGALTLANPVAGVTLTNPGSTYTGVKHVGSGTGTLTLTGSPPVPHQVIVRIDGTGASGAASWSTSLDGAPFVSQGSAASASNLGGTSINIALTNGGSGTSFVVNDTYTFATPGSWITTQGSNIETASPPGSNALAIRCRNRWPSLSPIPVNQFYQLLVTSTPTVGSQVVQMIVQQDPNIVDKVNIIVSGPAGALPGGTIATIQSYVSPRVPGGVNPVVVSPSTQAITYAGTVTVTVSQQAAATLAIATALLNYTDGININGTLRISAVIDQVMNVSGVVDFTGCTINGAATNLTLGSPATFVVPATPPTISFSYITVPG